MDWERSLAPTDTACERKNNGRSAGPDRSCGAGPEECGTLRIRMPFEVRKILQILHEAGYEACIVGGCVRDALMGREPKDWDITTSARPEKVKACFYRTIDTGIKHGTVTVLMRGRGYEVTTYRVDGTYEDGRHPTQVTFTPSLREDLARRDFTVNAMAYDEEGGLVDIFGGRRDLADGVIRAVGDPRERFTEDALRILRGLRFAARFAFAIEPETEAAMRELAPRLSLISAERVREELTGLLTSPHPELFAKAQELGITKIVLPEWEENVGVPQRNAFHCYPVDRHILATVAHAPDTPLMRWTMLLHDIGKGRMHTVDASGVDHFKGHAAVSAQMAEEILRRLRFDNDTIDKARTLITWHDYRFQMNKTSVRRGLSKVGEELFPALLEVMKADTLGKAESCHAFYLEAIETVREMYEEIREEGECFSLKDLAVNGQDLMAAGARPGPALGEALRYLLDLVIEDPALNQKEILLGKFREWTLQDNGSVL